MLYCEASIKMISHKLLLELLVQCDRMRILLQQNHEGETQLVSGIPQVYEFSENMNRLIGASEEACCPSQFCPQPLPQNEILDLAGWW